MEGIIIPVSTEITSSHWSHKPAKKQGGYNRPAFLSMEIIPMHLKKHHPTRALIWRFYLARCYGNNPANKPSPTPIFVSEIGEE